MLYQQASVLSLRGNNADAVSWRQNSVLKNMPMFGLKWKEVLVTGADNSA